MHPEGTHTQKWWVCSCSKVHACTSTADGPKSVHDCALRSAVSALHFHYWDATVQSQHQTAVWPAHWLTDWGLCWVTDGLTGGLLEGKSIIFWIEIKEFWYQTNCFAICKNNNAFHNTEWSKSEQAALINSALLYFNLKCLRKKHRALKWNLTLSIWHITHPTLFVPSIKWYLKMLNLS